MIPTPITTKIPPVQPPAPSPDMSPQDMVRAIKASSEHLEEMLAADAALPSPADSLTTVQQQLLKDLEGFDSETVAAAAQGAVHVDAALEVHRLMLKQCLVLDGLLRRLDLHLANLEHRERQRPGGNTGQAPEMISPPATIQPGKGLDAWAAALRKPVGVP